MTPLRGCGSSSTAPSRPASFTAARWSSSPPSTTPSSWCWRRATAATRRSRPPNDDKARKAFERVCRSALPDTHKQLERAIAREAREHAKRQNELATREHADGSPDERDSEPVVETEG